MSVIIRKLKDAAFQFVVLFSYGESLFKKRFTSENESFVGVISGEFFHNDLGRFGGYGKTAKNIADYFNSGDQGKIRAKVLISEQFPVAKDGLSQRFNNTDVILSPPRKSEFMRGYKDYRDVLKPHNAAFLLSIDYYHSYEYSLLAAPSTPLIVWIRDPRSKVELEKMITIPLELQTRRKSKESYLKQFDACTTSLKKIRRLSKILKRKVIFVSNGEFLIERAKRTYGLPQLNPHQLPNAIPLRPKGDEIAYSQRPSFCFLGRLDPVKRFWMFCELAKIFKQADFYLGGMTEFPELINPIINQYKYLSNLKFLDVVEGEEKHRLLKNSWALINTSIHEGYPVSFQEAFSYGKCVISSENPDGLVEKYGYYTGEILGEGKDAASMKKFVDQVQHVLDDKKGREEKGRAAKEFVEQKHSFSNFRNRLNDILEAERIFFNGCVAK